MVTRREKQIMIGLGVLLLIVGIVLSVYPETYAFRDFFGNPVTVQTGRYPYQAIGIVVTLIGVVFIVLGIFVRPTQEAKAVSQQTPPG
jgi:uncharacterized membrane protein